jgi:hypothetical protein
MILVSSPDSLAPPQPDLAGMGGRLEGHVRDSVGLPMPTAQVWIDGTAYGGVADVQGYYFIDNLPARVVNLTVTLVGYRRVQLKGVRISNGNTIAQDFSLEPVSPNSEIELDSEPVQQDGVISERAPDSPAGQGGKTTMGRIALGILTELSAAVIDSARNVLAGRILGSERTGLLGQVTTGTGQPIAGARIEVDGASYVLTGEDGRFLIQPPIGRKLRLKVSAPGYSTLETPMEKLKGGEGRRVFLRLRQ